MAHKQSKRWKPVSEQERKERRDMLDHDIRRSMREHSSVMAARINARAYSSADVYERLDSDGYPMFSGSPPDDLDTDRYTFGTATMPDEDFSKEHGSSYTRQPKAEYKMASFTLTRFFHS